MPFYDNFPSRSSNSILSELMNWQQSVHSMITSSMSPTEAKRVSMMGHLPIYMLPYEEQVKQMRAFRNIIGLDSVLSGLTSSNRSMDDQINDIFSNMRTITPRGESSPFLRFHNQRSGNQTLDYIYQSLNINYDESFRGTRAGLISAGNATASSQFGIGVRSIPKISPSIVNMPSRMAQGARYMSFDIETAGLMDNQIREVAFGIGTVGAQGHSLDEVGQALFRPRLFARGSRGLKDQATGAVRAVGLEQFMEGKYGLTLSTLPTEKLGIEYARQMMPFLENIKNVDHIVGHNILQFDLPQIFTSLTGTDAYKSADQSIIPGFRNLVDSAYEAAQSKVIDTVVLARQAPNLAGLQTAAELAKTDSKSIYSIENLLLETDLADRIGHKNLQKAMGGKGLHFAEVDNLVTMGLLEHLNDLQPKKLGGTQLANDLRRQIISSAAITPGTGIRSIEEVSDGVLKYLIRIDNGLSVPNRELKALLAKAKTDPAAAAEAFQKIRSGRYKVDFNLNSIEHQVLDTRRLGSPSGRAITPDDLLFGNNQFDQAVYGRSGRGVNYASGVAGQRRISDSEMRQIQQQLADRNMPWAGLSFEERSLGTVMSHLTSSAMPKGVRDLVSDTLVANFQGFDESVIQFTTNSGRPTLPANLLQQAGILDDSSVLRMSTVNRTIGKADPSVNLVYQFKDSQSQARLATFIEELADKNPDEIAMALGFNDYEHAIESLGVKNFVKAVKEDNLANIIRNADPKQGVTIAQLTGQQAKDTISALQAFTGMADLSDEKTVKFGLPFMATSNNQVQTTGVIIDRYMNEGEITAISENVAHARNVLGAYEEVGNSASKSALANTAINASGVAENRIKTVYEGYQSIRPHLGKGLIGAVVGLGALELYKSHRENKQYQATLAQMPYEPKQSYAMADVLQMQIASGINKSYQRYDPLATAFVTSDLSDSRINHTNMAPNKNNQLYGGVL